MNYRNTIKELSHQELFNQRSKHTASTKAHHIEVFNREDPSEDLKIKYYLKNESQKINDKIYFNPFSFKFFEENPFKQEKRSYPIDFGYKDFYMYSAVIEIPEGYKITELPEAKSLAIQGNIASLKFSAGKTGDKTINVNCRLTFRYASYPAEYYQALQQFFDKILEVQTQSLIVLEENS